MNNNTSKSEILKMMDNAISLGNKTSCDIDFVVNCMEWLKESATKHDLPAEQRNYVADNLVTLQRMFAEARMAIYEAERMMNRICVTYNEAIGLDDQGSPYKPI